MPNSYCCYIFFGENGICAFRLPKKQGVPRCGKAAGRSLTKMSVGLFLVLGKDIFYSFYAGFDVDLLPGRMEEQREGVAA